MDDRNAGLCAWDLTAPDENGHVELQWECGDRAGGINLGPVADVLVKLTGYIERTE